MACSMYEAGRYTVVSNSSPVKPGCISRIASSTPRVTARVFASGSFSITNSRPSPPRLPSTASPISGW